LIQSPTSGPEPSSAITTSNECRVWFLRLRNIF
jgi:hypothetical protein